MYYLKCIKLRYLRCYAMKGGFLFQRKMIELETILSLNENYHKPEKNAISNLNY